MIAQDRLAQIIPEDLALANKALAASLLQITNISKTTLPRFAVAVSGVQTMYGLEQLNTQTSAIPESVVNYYQSQVAIQPTATNPTGDVTAVASLGVPSGIGFTEPMANVLSTFTTMNLQYLTLCYSTLSNCLAGLYNVGTESSFEVVIPGTNPGAGTYASIDQAVTVGILPATDNTIANIQTAYSGQCVTLNSNWTTMSQNLNTGITIQTASNLVWADLVANSQTSIMGFVSSLPTYGQDTGTGGMSQYIEALADKTTLTGQAIIGVLRQGQTAAALKAAGIGTSLHVSNNPKPPPTPAVLLPAQPPYPTEPRSRGTVR